MIDGRRKSDIVHLAGNIAHLAYSMPFLAFQWFPMGLGKYDDINRIFIPQKRTVARRAHFTRVFSPERSLREKLKEFNILVNKNVTYVKNFHFLYLCSR